eukprot:scaffold1090_cov135-Isochrysis_galbana.AAC.8
MQSSRENSTRDAAGSREALGRGPEDVLLPFAVLGKYRIADSAVTGEKTIGEWIVAEHRDAPLLAKVGRGLRALLAEQERVVDLVGDEGHAAFAQARDDPG